MATETKISAQDRKDLDKFTKFLALKSIQVIVQSRLGDRIYSKSKPQSTGSDWFNLAIKDNGEVLAEARKHISNQLPTVGNSLCVEISLRTAEGDTMVLETWCLGVNERCDHQAKIHYTVYNRMALLLKSLICVCRVTPAYKLARKQGSDFGIYYRIYFGSVNLASALGEGFESIRVGSVATPIGTITLTAAYRTKLAIPDRQPSNGAPMTVKDDHFETSPKALSSRPCQFLSSGSSEKEEIPSSVLESQDSCATTFSTSPSTSGYVQTPQKDAHPQQQLQTQPINVITRTKSSSEIDKAKTGLPDYPGSFSSGPKRGAFVNTGKSPPDQGELFSTDIPFMSLLQEPGPPETPKNKNLAAVRRGSMEQPGDQTVSTGSNRSNSSLLSAPDDFVMVELKPAFAQSNSSSDLGAFYRECQTAPQLDSFSDASGSVQELEFEKSEVMEQLAEYEQKVTDFDDFVKSLQEDCSDNSS
ncbi:autophagy-related protein 13-like isoform X1 [Ptychodera flava]|uniref:autophagy-related protein 13-like isoform X1 n=1 Tax=Ptychodera flava TaxID=63121 RepID=UPI00396A03B5